MAKGKVVAKSNVKRKKGFLYYVDADGNVRETAMKRGGTKGAKRCSLKSLEAAKAKRKKATAKKKAAPKKKTGTAKRKKK